MTELCLQQPLSGVNIQIPGPGQTGRRGVSGDGSWGLVFTASPQLFPRARQAVEQVGGDC